MAVRRFPVEASHIMMFARAINDANPIYYDEGHAKRTEVGRIIAPPTFAQASAQFDPDYFLRPKVDEPWFGSGKEPTGPVLAAPRPGKRIVEPGEGESGGTSPLARHDPGAGQLRPLVSVVTVAPNGTGWR